MTTHAHSPYMDMAQWLPINHKRYAQAMGEATQTADEPDELRVTIEHLGDTRMRVVTWAQLRLPEEPSSRLEPYVMVLYQPESGEALCFERRDTCGDLAYA